METFKEILNAWIYNSKCNISIRLRRSIANNLLEEINDIKEESERTIFISNWSSILS